MNETPKSAEQRAQNLWLSKQTLDPDQVDELIQKDPEAAKFYILLLQSKLHEKIHPSTPSGQIPPYLKPETKGRKKKPGRKKGHEGSRRSTPPRIDRTVEHHLDHCPDCGGEVKPYSGDKNTRSRIIEDLPAEIQTEVTEHIIHRAYCPCCKKPVEPKVPDALPGATIGNRLLTLTAYWHYQLGIPVSAIVDLLNATLNFTISGGGLIQMWQRLAQHLSPWYEHLIEEILTAGVLYADETGWRVNGKRRWLWNFHTTLTTVFMIHASRGSPALLELFKEAFTGILVTDFYSVYDAIAGGKRQLCLAHLFRELEKVDQTNSSTEWSAFSKKVKRLFRDAFRLRALPDFSPEKYASRIQRMYERLIDLALTQSSDGDVKRLAKRLEKYRDDLLTFLEEPVVEPTNNSTEREFRFAVIMRKVMQGNRSEKGAWTQVVLMSTIRTLKRRGMNPVETIVQTLHDSISTNRLPEFPSIG